MMRYSIVLWHRGTPRYSAVTGLCSSLSMCGVHMGYCLMSKQRCKST